MNIQIVNTTTQISWRPGHFIGAGECTLFVVCVVLWLAWTVWQIASEHREYTAQARHLQTPGKLDKVFAQRAKDVS